MDRRERSDGAGLEVFGVAGACGDSPRVLRVCGDADLGSDIHPLVAPCVVLAALLNSACMANPAVGEAPAEAIIPGLCLLTGDAPRELLPDLSLLGAICSRARAGGMSNGS